LRVEWWLPEAGVARQEGGEGEVEKNNKAETIF
jgi:hypothetical protein